MTITKGPPRPDLYHPDREIPEAFRREPGETVERRQELRDELKARSIAREARLAQKKAAPALRVKNKARKLKAAQLAKERAVEAKLAAINKTNT